MQPGSRSALKNYEIISKIGSGGFGSVFKARSKRDGKIVAIKIVRLHTESRDQPGEIPSFAQREVQMLKQFSHQPGSHVCSLLCEPIHDSADRCLYLVFKYYPYDLNALILTEPLKFDQMLFYLHRLLLALEMLHKANLVHRDVKPENILIDVNHHLALTDLGLAREVTGSLTGKIGTQNYRGPEQLLGDTAYGTAVDIWAVGCVMYTMVTGKTLFEGQTDCDQFDEICNLMGSPTVEDWPGILKLPNANLFLPTKPKRRNFRKILVERFGNRQPAVTSEYIDLMMVMLDWNPDCRITAKDALLKPLFSGIESVGEKLPMLTVREAHQKKQISRVICDHWLEEFDCRLEFQMPRQCVV